MKKVIFNGHQGVGDWILCTGILKKLEEKYDSLIVPVAETAFYSVKRIFENDTKVKVVLDKTAVHGGKKEARPEEIFKKEYTNCEIITVGHCCKHFPLIMSNWDICMYIQAGVNMNCSWKLFSYPRDLEEETQLEKNFDSDCKIFLHDDPSRNYTISDKYKVKPFIYPNRSYTNVITNYTGILKRCTEINCIPSSFSLLIDRIDLPNNPILNLHVYSRPKSVLPLYKKDWNFIYENE